MKDITKAVALVTTLVIGSAFVVDFLIHAMQAWDIWLTKILGV